MTEGLRCKKCNRDNGITMYEGKKCARCGEDLGITMFPKKSKELKFTGG